MAYRSSSIGTPINAASWTVAVPSGLSNGDKVNIFLIAESGYFNTTTPPSGFTLDATESETSSGFRPLYVRRYWKDITNAAGEGSGGNYTFTFSSENIGYAVAVAHSGRAVGAGTDAATIDGAAGASPLSVVLNGVTAASGDDIIWFSGVAPDDDVDVFSITSSCTAPANYTSRQVLNSLWRIGQLATRDGVSSGATGTLSGSVTYTSAGTAQFTGIVVALASGGTDVSPSLTGQTTTSNAGALSVQITDSPTVTGQSITVSQGELVAGVTNNGTSGLGNTILDFGAGATTATATVIGQVNISSGSFADAFIMGTDTSTDHTADEHRDVILDVKVFNITPGTGFQIRAISSTTLTGKYRCRWVWTH